MATSEKARIFFTDTRSANLPVKGISKKDKIAEPVKNRATLAGLNARTSEE
jgi:hypothetical protein